MAASELDDFLHTLTLERQRSLRQRRARLDVVEGVDAGVSHEFDDWIRIGARHLAEVVLRDPKISGLHCEVTVGDAVRVRDLGSKNGTHVGGVRVYDAEIAHGELLRLGDTQIRIVSRDDTIEIPLLDADEYCGLIGPSAPMRALTARIQALASSDATVLVVGETGTGKELVAEALHVGGDRAPQPLVVVDAGALPAGLVEAELFGHEKGAFTGATATTIGAFERAHGGTLFLDEIGELPAALQPKLLRVLESRKVRRLGGDRDLPIDVRVVAATHRDLAVEVARGRFREDLYYRLAVVVLRVPSLRDRIDDLPFLAMHFLGQMGVDPHDYLTVDIVREMTKHTWPGNARELRNTLERAVALKRRIEIEPAALDGALEPGAIAVDLSLPLVAGRQRVIDSFERAYLQALLAECGGDISKTARRAGMHRMSIHRMMQRLGIPSRHS